MSFKPGLINDFRRSTVPGSESRQLKVRMTETTSNEVDSKHVTSLFNNKNKNRKLIDCVAARYRITESKINLTI